MFPQICQSWFINKHLDFNSSTINSKNINEKQSLNI